MPGPAPKPTALKKLSGNPGHRRLNRNEPKFAGLPTCPDWLTPPAKAEWVRVMKALRPLDMVKAVDEAALAAYCQSWARWQSAERLIESEGQTVQEPIVNKSGKVVGHKIRRHPAVGVAKDALAAMIRAAALFGLDPSSRSRIHVPGDQGNADPLEKFLSSDDWEDDGRKPM